MSTKRAWLTLLLAFIVVIVVDARPRNPSQLPPSAFVLHAERNSIYLEPVRMPWLGVEPVREDAGPITAGFRSGELLSCRPERRLRQVSRRDADDVPVFELVLTCGEGVELAVKTINFVPDRDFVHVRPAK